MEQIKHLAAVVKNKIFTANSKTNKGFTLIEILVVLVIIASTISIAIFSINLARPSPAQIFYQQLQNQISASKKFSQNYNIPMRISINADEEKFVVYQLNVENNKWNINNNIKAVEFNKIDVVYDLENINILPNGFINNVIITITDGDKILIINTINDKE